MVTSQANVIMSEPLRCLVRLTRHWGHRFSVEVRESEGEGHIFFEPGDCWLSARDGLLEVRVGAPNAEQLAELEIIVAEHVQRMSIDEKLVFEWAR